MITQGTKQISEMMKSSGVKLDEPQLVLMSAASLRGNRSASGRLVAECGLSSQEAAETLDGVWRAARKLAETEQFHELLQSSWFRQ